MQNLSLIKSHVDQHGIGCVVVNDHVAISVMWKSFTLSGEERFRETTERARSFEESCSVIGCRCAEAQLS